MSNNNTSMKIEIDRFIAELAECVSVTENTEGAFHNPYQSSVHRDNLRQYLYHLAECGVEVMLLSNSPVQQINFLTGVPFTDNYQIANEENEFILGSVKKYYHTEWKEDKESTYLWGNLRKYRMKALLWDIFPFRGFSVKGEAKHRSPNNAELQKGSVFAKKLQSIFQIPDDRIFALGKKSYQTFGLPKEQYIRHPSFGGLHDFEQGMERLNLILQGRAPEKPSKEKYLIGDVADMFGISIDTVRFYQKKGLIESMRDENQYRYFNLDQISNLNNIVLLRNLGISISELQDLSVAEDFNMYSSSLVNATEKLEEQIRILVRTKKQIELYSEYIRRAGIEKNKVILKESPAWWMVRSSRSHFIDESVNTYMKIKNQAECFPQYVFFSRPEDVTRDPISYNAYGVVMDRPFELQGRSAEKVSPRQCAYMLFEGKKEELSAAYRSLLTRIKDMGYSVTGDLMEGYILSNQSIYLLELWCPVQ
ncbi:MAG: MerR family DNA-binding transcriptional regulator [Eubacteriales bacterium]|nr:MerR family DNA-binding transcriptional regulator [Eubacteriales bacterium]